MGQRHFHLQRNASFTPILNVDKLWTLVGGADAFAAAEAEYKKTKKAAVIDLTKYGVFKLTGKGKLPELPVVVKTRFVSKIAEAKIIKAGGAVVLTA